MMMGGSVSIDFWNLSKDLDVATLISSDEKDGEVSTLFLGCFLDRWFHHGAVAFLR